MRNGDSQKHAEGDREWRNAVRNREIEQEDKRHHNGPWPQLRFRQTIEEAQTAFDVVCDVH